MVPSILSVAFGVAVIALTMSDVFQSVVMPRATGRRYRISFYVWRFMWHLWPRLAWRVHARDPERREEFLAIFAPLMLTSLIGLWVSLLIFGFVRCYGECAAAFLRRTYRSAPPSISRARRC
jgi:hypothetical protein